MSICVGEIDSSGEREWRVHTCLSSRVCLLYIGHAGQAGIHSRIAHEGKVGARCNNVLQI